MSGTGHFIEYGGRVEIDRWIIRNNTTKQETHHTSASEAAEKVLAQRGDIIRIDAVIRGERKSVCPHDAVKPVYDAMEAALA